MTTVDIKSLILEIYRSKPKHFAQILKRNNDVLVYINENVPTDITVFLEQLYYVVYGDDGICKNGNKKKLKSFDGYAFCGRTGVCDCAKESVSTSLSIAKSKYTTERKTEIQKKREQTTLEKYGVSNNGQTEKAKTQHAQFYQDSENVIEVIKRVKSTKLEKYGSETFNNRKKSEKTCLERYGVKNTWSLSEEKQNPALDILKDVDKLKEIFPKMSVAEIADTYKLHQQTIYWYLNKNGLREPYKSTFEKEIVYFLNELGITNILTNKRTIIGKELDIFLPEYNLAIEYNGVYWHHDKVPHITKTYHRDKFRLCEDIGIELFTIFSDSWDDKKDIWKSKIISKLGLAKKIYARKCQVVELNTRDTKDFLNNNHVQGYCTSEIAISLQYDDEIVALMTFSKNRAGIGKDRGEGAYELVRFASSKTVVGGASKLLSHFMKNYRPTLVVSYSDNQYSTGRLYKTLGFSLESDNSIGYRYFDPVKKKIYHRFNFTKSKLVKLGYDKNKTEKEIMNELGYLRIYDCGSKTWVLNCDRNASNEK